MLRPIWKRIVALRGHQAIIFLTFLGISFLVISFSIHQPGVEQIDRAFTREIQEWRSSPFDFLAIGFTFLGNTATLVTVALLAAVGFYFVARPRASLLVLITLIGLPLNMVIKELIGRPRPSGDLVSVLLPTIGLSYPSGHAMASTMLYGFLAVMAWIHVPWNLRRLEATVGFAITAVMISFSRVYVGAHWLSDVVGGMTAGLFCLLLLTEIYKWWNRDEFAPGQEEPILQDQNEPPPRSPQVPRSFPQKRQTLH